MDITRSPKFEKKMKRLDKAYFLRAEDLVKKIINNLKIGKPMMYERRGTRELYLSPFRLSYSYDPKGDHLILLDIYHKKRQ